MAQLFTPTPMDLDLGFNGEEDESDLNGAASGTEDDAPEPILPPAPEAPASTPAPEPQTPPGTPEAPAPVVQTPATPQTPPVPHVEPSLADILRNMEAQASRQTQILERAIPHPEIPAPGPKPLPPIPEKYKGVLDEDTLRGAQVVMDALGITADLEELKTFRQAATQKDNATSARDMILGQVPEMRDQAFQDEVAAEMTRTLDALGVPNEMRGQFLNPVLVVQAGNAVKARRSQNATAPQGGAAPVPSITQALASRAGGETQSEPVAASVTDTSEQPVDWMSMSEEDYAKRQAAILRKQNGSW